MLEVGYIERADFEIATAQPLDLRPPVPTPRATAFFVDHVRRALEPDHAPERLDGGELRIHTTLDARLQRLAQEAINAGLADLEERAPKLMKRDPPAQAALLALDPYSGDILAMVGGRDYGSSQFNRATQARRQPGSVFKTVVALAALDPPDPAFTLASTVTDDAIVIPAPEPLPGEEQEEDWQPLNHDEEFRGDVTLREALEESLNIPMVRIGQEVGLERVIETARLLGIRGRLRPVPSLALGTFEVSLLSMTRAYAVLASGGVAHAAAQLDPNHQPRRRSGGEPAEAAGACLRARGNLSGHFGPGGGSGPGYREVGARVGLPGPPGRQDRQQRRLPRRLVHRLHTGAGGRRVGRFRRRGQPGAARGAHGTSDLHPLHEGGAGPARSGGLPAPARRGARHP